MTVGPCLAAISGGPRIVIAVGAYSVCLLALLSWPDHPVERILQRRSAWSLTHAAGGVAGLELALATRFDPVLLDQDLPDMEGLETLRALRESEDRADVPIVIVSADGAPGQQKRALAAGANDYLVKPFTIDGLLEVLDGRAPSVE